MKKITSALLVILILFSMFFSVPVFAKAPVELKLTNATVYADDEFEIKVFISDNSQLSGAVIDLQYDASQLEFVSGNKGAIIDESAMVSINNFFEKSSYNYIRFTYLSPSNAIVSEGILFSVKFKALPNAEGETSIKISIPSAGDFVNTEAEKLAYTVEDSTVRIINETVNSTTEIESTTDESVTNIVDLTSGISESSTNNANIDVDNNKNDYIKIVIGLFVAGGIIVIGVAVYLIIIRKKKR